MDANMGGTEILPPLLDIINVERQMKNYSRHTILITDGEVSNINKVI